MTTFLGVILNSGHNSADYRRLATEGARQLERGEYESAITTLQQVSDRFPENAGFLYSLARACACQGLAHQATVYLRRAVDAGFEDHVLASADPCLENVEATDDFSRLLSQMQENERRWQERTETVHRNLDPRSAPTYESLDAIEQDFAQRAARESTAQALRGTRAYQMWRWRLADEKVAALRRYVTGRPQVLDREQAALRLVEVLAAYKPQTILGNWGGDGPCVVREAERFLAEFPDSPHHRRAAYLRAVALWQSRDTPQEDRVPYSRKELSKAVKRFAAVAGTNPSSTEEGLALAWQTALTWLGAEKVMTKSVRGLYATLDKRFREDPDVAAFLRIQVPGLLYAHDGVPALEGVDTNGRSWNPKALRGRVVLIDFWTTWCGACLREIPLLRQMYATYRGCDFEILGINLDTMDQDAFRAWIERNEVEWPQVHDGLGFDGPLAQSFEVRAIPLRILLDRHGRLLAAGLEKEELADAVSNAIARGRVRKSR